MGEKKSKTEGEKNQNDQKKNNNDGGKKETGLISVVLKVDIHCEGCASKIKKCALGCEGVESVKGDDKDSNKLTVTGKVDPLKLREKLEQKTKKKVELISPVPKKEKEKNGGGEGEKKADNNKSNKNQEEKKKSKEPAVTTAVFKVNTHCEGCIKKIHKIISKTKGYHEMSVDRQKDLITVKGSMDMKALAETLTMKLKRPVEIIPPKKNGGGSDGGDKKEKGGGGEGAGGKAKDKSGGDGKAAGNGGGGGEGGGGKVEQKKMEHVPYGFQYPYTVSEYAVPYQVHAPQLFSDENPNACSVM